MTTTPQTMDDDRDQNYVNSGKLQLKDGASQSAAVYLDFTGTVQTLLCSIIGFGIISLPYSVKIVGSMAVSITTNMTCASIMLLSTLVYLMVRTNVQKLYFGQGQQDTNNNNALIETQTNNDTEASGDGVKQLSISDICYILFGRSSIFLVNACLFISVLGFNVMFFLFIAQTILSLFFDVNFQDVEHERRIYFYKVLIIVMLTLVQLPITLKR